jgi:hypothetical protein
MNRQWITQSAAIPIAVRHAYIGPYFTAGSGSLVYEFENDGQIDLSVLRRAFNACRAL